MNDDIPFDPDSTPPWQSPAPTPDVPTPIDHRLGPGDGCTAPIPVSRDPDWPVRLRQRLDLDSLLEIASEFARARHPAGQPGCAEVIRRLRMAYIEIYQEWAKDRANLVFREECTQIDRALKRLSR